MTTRDPWQPTDGKCNARKTDGSGLCRHEAGWRTDHLGTGNCVLHGGGTRNGRAHGARLRAQGEFGELLERCGVLVEGREPSEAMRDALHRVGGMVVALSAMVAQLRDHADWHWSQAATGKDGASRWVIVESEGVIGPNAQGEAKAHPLVREYSEWLTLYGRLAKTAADMGIEERRTVIAEEQGRLVVEVLRGVLADLGIVETPEVAEIVGRRLRVVGGAA